MSADNSVEKLRLQPGEIMTVGNKVYGICAQCHSLVRVNKWLLGSLHICDKEPDLPNRQAQDRS